MDVENQDTNGAPNCSEKKMKYIQIWLGVISNMGALGAGMSLGFSAIALPQLTSPTNSFQLTPDQQSWFAGLAAISTPIGCLLSGPILDRWGRKMTLLLTNVPCFIGWLLIATVGDSGPGIIGQLYSGRLFTGLATGMTSVPATIYLAEIAADNAIRSVLVTWTSISIAAGILLVYILGAVFQESWRLISYICAVFPFVSFIVVMIFLPESPVWLMAKGKPDGALKSLKLLRGQKAKSEASNYVREEFEKISLNHTNSFRSQEKQTFFNNLKLLLRPEGYKPFIIMNTYFFFQQFSGIFVVIFYAVDVAKGAGVTIDAYLATVLIGLMRFAITIVVSMTSNKYGRRPPSIVSGGGMTICMGALSLYLLLLYKETIDTELAISLGWLPIVLLLLYIGSATIGFLTLPWAMMGEVYPARIRGIASGTTTCFAYICSFFIVKSYPQMMGLMGKHGVFLFYGIMALLGTIFVTIYLPETRGKSLQEIQEYFAREPRSVVINDVLENATPLLEQPTLFYESTTNNPITIAPMDSKTNQSV